jgi:hypothetical protein
LIRSNLHHTRLARKQPSIFCPHTIHDIAVQPPIPAAVHEEALHIIAMIRVVKNVMGVVTQQSNVS